MIVLENMPERSVPAIIAPAEAAVPDSADEKIARILLAAPAQSQRPRSFAPSASVSPRAEYSVALPGRIPAQCVQDSARAYQLSPLILLAILKVESNGRFVIGNNSNGTKDISPAQFNTESWFKTLTVKYRIPPAALMTDMCQVVRALGFVVRTEINAAGGDFWTGVGNYHSRTKEHHYKYRRMVDGAYRNMISKGKF